MPNQDSDAPNRRRFLASSGALVGSVPALAHTVLQRSSTEPVAAQNRAQTAAHTLPIGVFTDVFDKLSLDAMLDRVTTLGLDAVEAGTGNYVGVGHCPLNDLLADSARARAWKSNFERRNIRVGALSCHGNPLHPDATLARNHDRVLRDTIVLAERLDVPVVVTFSGCPGDSPSAKYPNWATYTWPPDYEQILKWQWSERVVPYWQELGRFAQAHGRKIALEMHPGFVVYNPRTMLRLRAATGDAIGANCDLSHLFWQGCDPVEVIRMLGGEGALFHAHMKDTVLFGAAVARYGVIGNQPPDLSKPAEVSVMFRSVGYGHSAELWKEILKAYMEVGYRGILSIENEDPLLAGEPGVRAAAEVLKAVRSELMTTEAQNIPTSRQASKVEQNNSAGSEPLA